MNVIRIGHQNFERDKDTSFAAGKNCVMRERSNLVEINRDESELNPLGDAMPLETVFWRHPRKTRHFFVF